MTPSALIDDPSTLAVAMSSSAVTSTLAADRRNLRARSRGPSAFLWILLAASLLLMALAAPSLLGRVYTADDLGAFHLPMRAFYRNCLAHGDRFDWSPQLFCGFFLTGEGQVGTYHPWHYLLYRLLPLGAAFDLECVANYPVLLLGVYCFLRRWRLRRDAALFGGLMFTFSGFCLLHFVHVNCIAVLAHVPWLLVAIDGAVRGRTPRRRLFAGAALALLTGSQILLGYPQIVAMSLLLEASYALMLLRRVGKTAGRECDELKPGLTWLGIPLNRMLALLFWKVLGVAIGGVQLLPTLEAVGESSRTHVDAAFRGWGSLDPLNLIQFVAPYLFKTRVVGQNTHEFGCYAGSVTFMLAAWCVATRAAPRRLKPLARAALILAVVGLLFALGERGPLYPLLAWLPLVNKFRFPCRAIVLVHFALAVLAAIGWTALGRNSKTNLSIEPQRRSSGFVTLLLLVLLSFVFAIGGPHWWTDYVAPAWQIWTGPLLAFSAAMFVMLAARRVPFARLTLVILMTADLGVYGLSYAVYPHAVPLDQYIAHTSIPPGAPDTRVAADLLEANQPGLRQGNALTISGWKRVDGYAGLMPAKQLDYRRAVALRAAGVGWIAASARVAVVDIPQGGSAAWLPWPASSLPRARLVTRAVASSNAASDLAGIPIETTALVEPSVESQLKLDPGPAGTVAISEDRLGSIRLKVNSPGRQLLVVSESFHSGWIATIAGKPRPVLRVNGDFMGCVVEAGTVEVWLEFHPASLIAGERLTAGGLSLLMAVLLIGSWRTAQLSSKLAVLQRSPAHRD